MSVAIPPDFGPREIMPADSFAASPWDALKIDDAKPDEIGKAYHDMVVADRAAAVRAAERLIADPELRPLLEALTDITLRRPTVLGYGPHAMELAREREGANRIVWLIYQMIAEARGQMPPPREGC